MRDRSDLYYTYINVRTVIISLIITIKRNHFKNVEQLLYSAAFKRLSEKIILFNRDIFYEKKKPRGFAVNNTTSGRVVPRSIDQFSRRILEYIR